MSFDRFDVWQFVDLSAVSEMTSRFADPALMQPATSLFFMFL